MDRPEPEYLDHAIRCETCSVRDEIRKILNSSRPPAERLRAVQLALSAPRGAQEIVLDDRGWPVLFTAVGLDGLEGR
jgi:hypothetical protein